MPSSGRFPHRVDQGPLPVFRKTGAPECIALERVKTASAWDVAQRSGLFAVPRVLRGSEEELAVEYVPSYRSLAELALAGELRQGMVRQSGRALAVVHERLRLPAECVRLLPGGWSGEEGSRVFVHGDYTMNNVGWDFDADGLVVTDWSCVHWIDPLATVGDPLFDVMRMIGDVMLSLPVRTADGRGELARAFIEGYREQGGRFDERRFAKLKGLRWRDFKTAHPSMGARARMARKIVWRAFRP